MRSAERETLGKTIMAEIRVPTLGELVTEATIGKWFKQAGDAVAVDEPLVELETDKVTIEVPAPAAGVLAEIAAKDGETVAVGALLGEIKEGAGAPSKVTPAPPAAPIRRPTRRRPSMPRKKSRGRARKPRPSRRLLRRSRPRCASWPRRADWTSPLFPAPARTAASPRAT